jgi:hypothetical protein
VPVLDPEGLQSDGIHMTISVGEVDPPAMTINKKAAHPLSMITSFIVRGRGMFRTWPSVHPVAIAIERHIGAAV